MAGRGKSYNVGATHKETVVDIAPGNYNESNDKKNKRRFGSKVDQTYDPNATKRQVRYWGSKVDPPAYNMPPMEEGLVEEEHQPEAPVVKEEDELVERGQWGNKAEFILSCVGLSVGLGNVWRFPYLAYKNGGAAFVLAYLILQLVIGKPMYFMELVMGQFSGKGPTKVWDMNPSAKGIGVSMCMVSLCISIYYNIIMAYTLFFFFASMQETLPWTHCKEEWIKEYNCVNKRTKAPEKCTDNGTVNNMMGACTCTGDPAFDSLASYDCSPSLVNGTTAAELFFNKEVLHKSIGLEPENIGTPLYKLALLLLLSWTVVVFCLIKGIKSSGKVVYFTATFPYFILLILLVRGSLLDGAAEGVEFFIYPKWDKLSELEVWVDAAGQMFFSLSVSMGGIIMFGSYNKFTNMVYYDALFISIMDLVTSVIAGFVVFTTFGGMAKTIGTTVDQVATAGYGLAFVVYPEALSHLQPEQMWSILFFFMLFTLGLDSEFGLQETILTCIQDEFPHMRRHKSKLAIGMGIMCYLIALPMTCPGGDYILTLMDGYGANMPLLMISCLEVIAVNWVYGTERFLRDIKYMLGSKPKGWPYWAACWTVTSPVLIGSLLLYTIAKNKPPAYSNGEPYPDFAIAIGWFIFICIMAPVLIFFLWRLRGAMSQPAGKRMEYMFEATDDWIPNDGNARCLVPEINGHGHQLSGRTGIDNPSVVTDRH